jgi:hypothetical protein
MTRRTLVALLCALAAVPAPPARAASHSDGPLSKQDIYSNITDVYAFIGKRYDNPDQRVLNVVVAVRPIIDPGDGVVYDRFAGDAVYSIHITNPATGVTLCRYDFTFTSGSDPRAYKNLDTILSYGRGANTAAGPNVGPIRDINDATRNFTQRYTVTKTGRGVIGSNIPTAPPNVGARTTPLYNDATGRPISGQANFADLDLYTRQAVTPLRGGEVSFAGERDDGFYADIAGIFDLLDPRIIAGGALGQTGGGVDFFKGYDVLNYSLQIPVANLPAPMPFNSPFFPNQRGVGVYASVSRPRVRILQDGNPGAILAGPPVQVNRMGNPLFNEVLVALRDKDRYILTSPPADAQYAKYARNPEVALLLNATFGTGFATANRTDLETIYIPDVLRVNTTTDPVRLPGQSGFSRLGFIGGDTTNGVSGGWPNGRRLGDDTIDIALTAIASGPAYTAITVVGDNVPSNDQAYPQVFPYSATPHAGPTVRQD